MQAGFAVLEPQRTRIQITIHSGLDFFPEAKLFEKKIYLLCLQIQTQKQVTHIISFQAPSRKAAVIKENVLPTMADTCSSAPKTGKDEIIFQILQIQ